MIVPFSFPFYYPLVFICMLLHYFLFDLSMCSLLISQRRPLCGFFLVFLSSVYYTVCVFLSCLGILLFYWFFIFGFLHLFRYLHNFCSINRFKCLIPELISSMSCVSILACTLLSLYISWIALFRFYLAVFVYCLKVGHALSLTLPKAFSSQLSKWTLVSCIIVFFHDLSYNKYCTCVWYDLFLQEPCCSLSTYWRFLTSVNDIHFVVNTTYRKFSTHSRSFQKRQSNWFYHQTSS